MWSGVVMCGGQLHSMGTRQLAVGARRTQVMEQMIKSFLGDKSIAELRPPQSHYFLFTTTRIDVDPCERNFFRCAVRSYLQSVDGEREGEGVFTAR